MANDEAPARITAADFARVLREGLPSADAMNVELTTLVRGRVVARLHTSERDLRPGGTVAGPVLFALADLALYAVVMSVVGPIPLCVTTDATMHFLRRPRAGVLIASARLLKGGQRLMVGDVEIANEGEESDPVAHAVMTYSVPPPEAR
jgi:uncharacterized protein (TIGR00369 family)